MTKGAEEVRINKHEERSERRRAEPRFQKDDPNVDQREKEREDYVAHQDRSGFRGYIHRVHSRVEQKPVFVPDTLRFRSSSPTATRSFGF